MLNDILNIIKDLFKYIKHGFYTIIEFFLTNKYRKSLAFLLCLIIFYPFYLLFEKFFIIVSGEKFTYSKFNYLLRGFFLLISIIIFYLLLFRNKGNDKESLAYFKSIFQIDDNTKFKKLNKLEFNEKIYFPLKNIFHITLILFFVGLFGIFSGLLFIYFLNLFKESTNLLAFLLISSIIFTILSIIAIIFKITLKQNNCNNINQKNFMNKLLCILFNIIFFIPCLLIIFADSIKQELNSTSPTIFIIFALEILFVLLLIIIPKIIEFLDGKNDYVLKKNEILYLNEKKEIGDFFPLNKKFNTQNSKTIFKLNKYSLNYRTKMNDKDYKFKNKYDYNYIIGFEIYLNPQPRNTSLAYNKETVLFNYANKPAVYYDGRTHEIIIKTTSVSQENDKELNGKNLKDNVVMRFKANSKDNKYHFNYQKWNKFLLKYNDGKLEIILNNKIVGITRTIPTFNLSDKIIIGEENGIHGGIKNIYYKSFSDNDWNDIFSDLITKFKYLDIKKNTTEWIKNGANNSNFNFN